MEQTFKKQKRYWIPLLILLILGGIAFGAWYYFAGSPNKGKHVEKVLPHIKMAHFRITDIDGEHVKLTTSMVLQNTFPIALKTKRIQYQIYIDTAMIVESSYNEPIDVASSDSISLDFPMEVSLKRIFGILKEFKKQNIDSTNYKVVAQIYLDLPIAGEKQFDIEIIKRLPTVIIPEIKLVDTDIKKLGLKESGVDMAFAIYNHNNYDIKLNDGKFDVKLDDNLELIGTMEDIQLKAKGTQTVSVHFDIKTNKLGKAVWKLIFDKKGTRFNMIFKCIADANNDILNKTNLIITADGTLDEALDAVQQIK